MREVPRCRGDRLERAIPECARGGLVVRDGLVGERFVHRHRCRLEGDGIDAERLDPAVEREHRQHVVLEVAQLLIVADESPSGCPGQLEHRAAEEIVFAVGVEHVEDRRREVDLAHRRRELAAGCDELGRVENDGDPVVLDGEPGLASHRRAVVGDDDEQRLVEPRLRLGVVDELADCPVRVLDAPLAPARRADVDAAVGVSERPVIRRRHHMRERWLALRRVVVDQREHVGEKRLVGDAPDVLEDDGRLRKVRAVHHAIVIPGEVGVHVVEVAVTAVDKARRVPLPLQNTADCRQAAVVRPPHDRLPRNRGRADRRRLEAAHRPRPGGVGVGELESPASEAIDVGRQAHVRSVRADELRRQALHHDQHHMPGLARHQG
jgi:hypothetical protein